MNQALSLLNGLPIGSPRIRMAHGYLVPDSLDRLAASLFWKFGWLEARERRWIERTVQPGMTAVDVGANIGFHTLTLAHCVGREGRVHAVEPEPRNFRALSRAMKTSGFSGVRLHQAAAGERSAPVRLRVSAVNRGDHRVALGEDQRAVITVAGVILDDLLSQEERVDFVKIDVQGAEAQVLRGLEKTLDSNPDLVLLCEICPRLLTEAGTSKRAFFEPLQRAGLRPHLLGRRARLEPITETRAWELSSRSGFVNAVFTKA